MADRASVDSNESVTTSDEYEIVPSITLHVKSLKRRLSAITISCCFNFSLTFQKCDGRPELNIGGDGDLEQMQKCLGEILDEENEQNSINTKMADTDINSDTSLANSSELVFDDLGILIDFLCRYTCLLISKLNK